MAGPKLPVTVKICDNVASPCTNCDNAGENEPKSPALCDHCEKIKEWEARECSPKSAP